MKFGPFRPDAPGGLRSAFRQLSSGLYALSTENFSKRGVKEQVFDLPIKTWEPKVYGDIVASHDSTLVANYIELHHLVFVDFKVTFTSSSTAGVNAIVTMPFRAKDNNTDGQVIPASIIDTSSGLDGSGVFVHNTRDLYCRRYDGANWATSSSGRQIAGTGWYMREL